MYIFLFFIILGVSVFLTNEKNDIGTSQEFNIWDTKDILVIAALFTLAILLQLLDQLIIHSIYGLGIYAFICALAMIYVSKSREKSIEAKKVMVKQIANSLKGVIKPGNLMYDDLPFTFDMNGDLLEKIEVDVEDPSSVNTGACLAACNALGDYFPYYKWVHEIDYQHLKVVFDSQRLPPNIALWPGDDLRSANCIPLGLSGAGEVCWSLSGGDKGRSSYVYEDGTVPDAVDLPPSYQCITVGATGGGKAIWTEQRLW